MAGNNSFLDNKSPEIIGNATIYITKKSVQFGQEVYQLHNVTGFAASEIAKTIIPIKFLLVGFIVGLIMANFSQFRIIGIVTILGLILCICYNIF